MCCEIDIAPAASRVLYIYKLIHPNLNYSPHRTVLTELKVNPRDICLTKFKWWLKTRTWKFISNAQQYTLSKIFFFFHDLQRWEHRGKQLITKERAKEWESMAGGESGRFYFKRPHVALSQRSDLATARPWERGVPIGRRGRASTRLGNVVVRACASQSQWGIHEAPLVKSRIATRLNIAP